MAIDLEELYKRTQKEGVIDAPESSGKVDLEAIWEATKKNGVMDAPITAQEKPKGSILGQALRTTGSVMGEAIGRSNMSFENIVGGPGQEIAQQVKRSVLDRAMPSEPGSVVGPAFKEALVQGTFGGNVVPGAPAFDQFEKATKSVLNGNFGIINFGGDKALRKIAVDAKRQLNSAARQFESKYAPILEKVGDKPVPHNMIDSIILDGIDQVPENSQASKYLDKVSEQIDGATFKELHALKGKVFKTAKSLPGTERNAVMKVYEAINDTLSGMDKDYSDLTTNYSAFMRNEAGYVKGKILDKFKNLTEAKLGGKMDENTKAAFEGLANRTGKKNLVPEVDSIRRGNLVRSYGKPILKGIAGAGGAGAAYGAYKLIDPD